MKQLDLEKFLMTKGTLNTPAAWSSETWAFLRPIYEALEATRSWGAMARLFSVASALDALAAQARPVQDLGASKCTGSDEPPQTPP